MMSTSRRTSFTLNILLIVFGLVVGLFVSEGIAQFYAYYIAKEGKLFRPDSALGWHPLSNLDLVRDNANGDAWHIVTNQDGLRSAAEWQDGRRRLLIVGDSFSFGEGVNQEDRYDTLIQQNLPDLSIVNLGVIGYATDQEMIIARPWKSQLRAGDIMLIQTYSNDFFDMARTTHSGRSKPWFEESAGALVEHAPHIGLVEIARDRSYIFSLLARTFNTDQSAEYEARLQHTGEVYDRLIASGVQDLMERGVFVVILHHGDHIFPLPYDIDQVFASTCRRVTACLDPDPALAAHSHDEMFLHDGHWAPGGHKVAAQEITAYLRTLPSTPQPQPQVVDRAIPNRS